MIEIEGTLYLFTIQGVAYNETYSKIIDRIAKATV
jgi:hypothetical protein